MTVRFGRTMLECAGDGGEEVGGLIEKGFGALSYEAGSWGRLLEIWRERRERWGRGDEGGKVGRA